jgi:hypothetical protein
MTEQQTLKAPPSMGRLVAHAIKLGYAQPGYEVGDLPADDDTAKPAVSVLLTGNAKYEDVEGWCLIDNMAPYAPRNPAAQERLAVRSALAEAIVFMLDNRDTLRR